MATNKNSEKKTSVSDKKDARTQIIIAIISAIAVILAAIIGANWFSDWIKPDQSATDSSASLVQVKVTDKETASPITNAQVQLRFANAPGTTKTTNSEGIAVFTLSPSNVGQLSEISVTAFGYVVYEGMIQTSQNVIAFPIPIQLEKK